MKKIKIIGGFNNGLKVYSENGLIMYSEVEKSTFKSDFIKIFNKQKICYLNIKQSSGFLKTEYQIENQKFENGSSISIIKNGIIELLNGDIIKFKKSLTSIITNPYLKIYYENVEIGKINNKKLGFKLDYTIFIKEEYEKLLDYILTYILTTESNKDYE